MLLLFKQLAQAFLPADVAEQDRVLCASAADSIQAAELMTSFDVTHVAEVCLGEGEGKWPGWV